MGGWRVGGGGDSEGARKEESDSPVRESQVSDTMFTPFPTLYLTFLLKLENIYLFFSATLLLYSSSHGGSMDSIPIYNKYLKRKTVAAFFLKNILIYFYL